MANTKISQLPQNNNPTGAEELVYAFNNSNGKMTLNTMKTFAQSDLSNYQEKLVSGTNIKTINGEDLLGSGNIVIQGGGGGGSTGTISLNALENIAAGTLVSFNGAGVHKLRKGFYGTADTGITLTSNTQQYQRIGSVAVSSNTAVVAYMNGLHNVYAVAIKYEGETRTVGTPVQINTTSCDGVDICSTYEGEFIVAYKVSGGMGVVACSVTGTTISTGTESIISNNANHAKIIRTSDSDERKFVAFYINTSDSKLYYNIFTYSSALAITAGTDSVLRGDAATTSYIGAGYLGGGSAAVVREYSSGGTHYTDIVYASVSGGTISGSNYSHLYEGTSTQLRWYPKVKQVSNNMFLIDTNAIGVFLFKKYGTGTTSGLIQNITPNQEFPVDGRDYCIEDINEGIIGMFGIVRNASGSLEQVYTRYKGTETGLQFIESFTNGSVENNSSSAVTRLGNVSVCVITNTKLYSTILENEENQYAGMIESAATSGNSVDVTYSGVVDTTGLTSGTALYVGLDGAIATYGTKQIGIATSSTQALLK